MTPSGSMLYKVLFSKLENAFKAHYASIPKQDPSLGEGMSGEQFELEIAKMLEKCGCQWETTPRTGDQGADLIAHYKNRKLAIQVKRWSGAVGNGAVQEVIAAQKYYRCNEAWVLTNSRFTKAARELATVHDVTLPAQNVSHS